MKLLNVLLVSALILTGTALQAQELVQFDAANPPFMFAKEGTAAGLYPALFQEAFQRMGVKATFAAVPWKRALEDTDSGKAGTGGIYQNADRLAKYDFSDPYFEERLAVFVIAGKEFPFTKASDLKGKVLNAILGWSYGEDFDGLVKDGRIKVELTDSDKTNFAKLLAGRNEAVVATVESGNSTIKALKAEGKVVMLPHMLSVSKVYLAFGKSANKSALLVSFNKAIGAMKKDGTFDSIVAASFSGN
jgi:polar amino acid transport system substrate-binding protein